MYREINGWAWWLAGLVSTNRSKRRGQCTLLSIYKRGCPLPGALTMRKMLPPPMLLLASSILLVESQVPCRRFYSKLFATFFKNQYTSSTTLQSSLLGPPLPPAICLSVGCLCLIHPRTVALKENTGTLKPWNRVGSAPKMDVNAPEQSKPAFPMVRKDSSQKPATLRERRSCLTSPLDQRSPRNRGGQTKLKRVLIGIAGIDDICVPKHNMYISGASAEGVFIAEEVRPGQGM